MKVAGSQSTVSHFSICARDETRTHTGFTPLAPETSASTISPPAHIKIGLQRYGIIDENQKKV